MSDIKRLLAIMNENTVAGGVATVAAPMGEMQKRVEETQEESAKAPEVIEYGMWENSALATTSKLKKNRDKSAKVVKSIYGEDVQVEAKKTPASNKPVDPKDLVVSLKDVPTKKPRGHKQYDPAKEFPGVKAFQKEGVAEGKFVKAAGGVPSDRYGNPKAEKPPKSVSTMTLRQLEKNKRENPGQSPFKTQDEKVKKYLGLEEQGVAEGSIKDAEQALARHGQYKVDHEKKYGPMSGADLHQHEVMRKQLLDKKRRAQSAYAKKQGVAEGYNLDSHIKQTRDRILKYKDWNTTGSHDKKIKELQDKLKELLAQKKQGVAEGSEDRKTAPGWHSDSVKNPNFNDELSGRRVSPPGKRLKSGKLSADERGSQERTKALMKFKKAQGGLTGPKGVLPEESVAEGISIKSTDDNYNIVNSKGEVIKQFHKTPKGLEYAKQFLKQNKGNTGLDENTVAEGTLEESDLILNPAGISKRVRDLVSKETDRTDHEVEMAKNDLYQCGKNASQIFKMIRNVSEEEGLEGWVQEKIIKAADYLNTVREYLEGKMMESADGVAQSTKMFTSEGEMKCSECGGVAYEDEKLAEEKDACYSKVKSRYKVWPSAYASGALVKCRKVGAKNWGNKSKK